MNPLSALQKYLIIGLVVALLATGLGWFVHTSYLRASLATSEGTVEKQRGEIASLEASLTTAVEANKTLETSLANQTSKVNQWLDAAERRQAASEKAIKQAKAEGERWKKKYSKLLDAPPSNPADQCQSLEQRIDQYLQLRSDP